MDFGRTLFTQGIGTQARDHNPHVFTCSMAGAGVKSGMGYGSSDEVGFELGENEVTIYEFHGTIHHVHGSPKLQRGVMAAAV